MKFKNYKEMIKNILQIMIKILIITIIKMIKNYKLMILLKVILNQMKKIQKKMKLIICKDWVIHLQIQGIKICKRKI